MSMRHYFTFLEIFPKHRRFSNLYHQEIADADAEHGEGLRGGDGYEGEKGAERRENESERKNQKREEKRKDQIGI